MSSTRVTGLFPPGGNTPFPRGIPSYFNHAPYMLQPFFIDETVDIMSGQKPCCKGDPNFAVNSHSASSEGRASCWWKFWYNLVWMKPFWRLCCCRSEEYIFRGDEYTIESTFMYISSNVHWWITKINRRTMLTNISLLSRKFKEILQWAQMTDNIFKFKWQDIFVISMLSFHRRPL